MYNNLPLISVVLPVYNGERFLAEAIDSILQQTFTDFELIIINDCSKDNSSRVINTFSDSRIKYLENSTNRRTAYSLNKGIKISKGKYIVRMDQDDIAFENRFQEQFDFMEANPTIGVSGTQITRFGLPEIKQGNKSNYPLNHEEIQLTQMYKSPFAHPSVIIRKKILIENRIIYDESLISEDHSLWTQLLLVTKSANLPLVLLKYRIHQDSITKTFFKIIPKELKKIRLSYIINLFSVNKYPYPFLLTSGIPSLRAIAVNYFVRSNSKFEKKLLVKHFEAFDHYFRSRNRLKYYLCRILNYKL